jgi:hypothetical protein
MSSASKGTSVTETEPKRGWFRFSLLAFLIGITLFGCVLGLVLRHRDPHTPLPLAKTVTLDVYLVSPAGVLTPRSMIDRSTGNAVYLIDPPILTAGDFALTEEGRPQKISGR